MAINKHYLNLEFGSGNFFEYSKEEKDGYEKHVSSKGNTSYRKYFKDGVSGVIESVSVYDGKFGAQISMNIKNGDDVYYTPVDLYDQRGNVSTFGESLIKLLPNLNKGDNVTVRGYNFTPEGEKYAKIGVSIKVNDNKVKSAFTNAYYKDGKLVKGDIPAIEWKKDALGKNKPSATSLEKKDEFLIGVLKEQTERLKWDGNSSNTSTEPVEKKEPTPVKEVSDDLPF